MADIDLDLSLVHRPNLFGSSPGRFVALNNQTSGGGNTYNTVSLTVPSGLFEQGVLEFVTVLTINGASKHVILEPFEYGSIWTVRGGQRRTPRVLSSPLGYRTALNWKCEFLDLERFNFIIEGDGRDVITMNLPPTEAPSGTNGDYIIDLSIRVLSGI